MIDRLNKPVREVGTVGMIPTSATALTAKRAFLERLYVANNAATPAIVSILNSADQVMFRRTVDPLASDTQGQVLLSDEFGLEMVGLKWQSDTANVWGDIRAKAEGLSG